MIGIFKTNEIETVGGTVPQGDGVELAGDIAGWGIVEIDESAISSVQEFDIQMVDDSILTDMDGPQQEGAYNAPAYELEAIGDKLTFEMNPGQEAYGIEGVEDGTSMTSPDEMDDQSQKNYSSDEVAPYKAAYATVKKITAKSILRDDIRGNIIDIEDDLSDTKAAVQGIMYYLTNEWNLRTDAQKATNPNMTKFTDKLLSDEVKMSSELQDGITKMNTILENEEAINNLVSETYKYDSSRGI
ncbi:MAG: hypothetical protein DRH57_09390 [Candidatus Cloacimonadota bacterium]|nr:MAG: hypothetical protein DRH57_09390 [Candidatus Cloacimonadota bacterium]